MLAPGEVHINVKMENTLALLQAKEQDPTAYEATLAKGREELKRLRSMDLDSIVSKKDMQIERERQEIEREYAKSQVNKRKNEELEAKAKEERQKAMKENLQNSFGSPSGDDKEIFPVVLAGLAGAVVAGASLTGTSDDNEQVKEAEIVTATPPPVNQTQTSMELSPIPWRDPNVVSEPEVAPETSDETSEQETIISKEAPADSPEVEQDPILAAEAAMQDYLNQDDGGDAWLQVMGQLMEGDEDNEIMFEEEFGEVMVNGSQDRLEDNLVVLTESSSSASPGMNETTPDAWDDLRR
jgi:hypothetical protein